MVSKQIIGFVEMNIERKTAKSWANYTIVTIVHLVYIYIYIYTWNTIFKCVCVRLCVRVCECMHVFYS